MYKRILAVLLLAFALGALCPAPATATNASGTESNYRHRRHRRHHGGPLIIIRALPDHSN
jgi:hypothetical protein